MLFAVIAYNELFVNYIQNYGYSATVFSAAIAYAELSVNDIQN